MQKINNELIPAIRQCSLPQFPRKKNDIQTRKVLLTCICAQSCPTLCKPMDYSLPGSSVHEIFQAWILEWVAISFSRGSSGPRDQTLPCLALERQEIDRWVLDQLSHWGSSPYTSIIFIPFSNQLFFPWKLFIAEITLGKCHPVPIGLTGTIENCHFTLENNIIILLPWTMLT